jgi:hypothetical protein
MPSPAARFGKPEETATFDFEVQAQDLEHAKHGAETHVGALSPFEFDEEPPTHLRQSGDFGGSELDFLSTRANRGAELACVGYGRAHLLRKGNTELGPGKNVPYM